MNTIEDAITQVRNADAIFIGAGAGFGVDSGLPDFRGNAGFWNAYPPFKERGLGFIDLANPRWFDDDPELAWAFYGHRLHLYRDTEPHSGFDALRLLANGNHFVFTSNVDGQFQKAGFADDRIVEVHGSIHHAQCRRPCSDKIWPAVFDVAVDDKMQITGELPTCPTCGAIARPNILMFGDGAWISDRSATQELALEMFFGSEPKRLAVIEVGAGTAVPTVRYTCERVAAMADVPLIRINPRESQGPPGTLSIAMGAAEALEIICHQIK